MFDLFDAIGLMFFTSVLIYSVLGLRALRNMSRNIINGSSVPHDWEA